MNIKATGVIATILAFGVGVAIPNIAGPGTIDRYDEALAIVEGKSTEKKVDDSKSEDTGTKDDNAKVKEPVETSENTVTKNEAKKESDTEKEKLNNANVNLDADVVLGFIFDDIEVNGIKFIEADYDSMLDGFGFNKVQVEYTDGGFKINSDQFEWEGKKASYHGGYQDENRQSHDLYFDGEKFVTSDLTEKESINNSIFINGSWEDKDNYTDYWSFDYSNWTQDNASDYIRFGNYAHGLSDKDINEISSFVKAPFCGGDYAAMNEVMRTEEMIEKGLKDQSASKENYEKYIVDTSLGKCVLTISTADNNDGKQTNYSYEFEDGKYTVKIWFRDGIESSTSISYYYKH